MQVRAELRCIIANILQKTLPIYLTTLGRKKYGLTYETKNFDYGKFMIETLSENIFNLLHALTALGDIIQIEATLFLSHQQRCPMQVGDRVVIQNCRHFAKNIADIINHFRQKKCGLSSETKILITPLYD
jgi:hypothetical protein